MQVPPVGRARAAGRERGAVAVEAALVTPLLVLIVFGIIEFGMFFKDLLGVTSAVRAGARIASAEPGTATFAQDAADQVAQAATAVHLSSTSELWVYKATGTTGQPGSCSSSCIRFTWNPTTQKFVTTNAGAWPGSAQHACVTDTNRDSVGVYLQVDHPTVTGLVLSDVTLKQFTVMNLEPIPAGSCP
jgi:Flp pilus assembly protein TadG